MRENLVELAGELKIEGSYVGKNTFFYLIFTHYKL